MQHVLPAVVVLICNWDPFGNWKENEADICTQFEIVKYVKNSFLFKLIIV